MTAAQLDAHLEKAEEYVAAAAAELQVGRAIAATSLAIHAAINTADVVAGARLDRCAAGQDHDRALVFVEQAGRGGAMVEEDLGRLLSMKTKAEYEPEGIPTSAATKTVEQGQRCVAVARRAAPREANEANAVDRSPSRVLSRDGEI